MYIQYFFLQKLEMQIQWGSEIWTSLGFEWSKRAWVANGLDFKWNQKFGSPTPFEIQTNGRHFVKNHLKYFESGQKRPDFEWLGQ